MRKGNRGRELPASTGEKWAAKHAEFHRLQNHLLFHSFPIHTPISTFILWTGMIRLKQNSTYLHTHSRCPDTPIQNILLLIWTNPPATQPYSPIHFCSVPNFRMVFHLYIEQISFPVVKCFFSNATTCPLRLRGLPPGCGWSVTDFWSWDDQ